MTKEQTLPKVEIASIRLEKRDENGDLFEVIEQTGDEPPRVTFTKPGQPPEAYMPRRDDECR